MDLKNEANISSEEKNEILSKTLSLEKSLV
jgi:hypothetical protein